MNPTIHDVARLANTSKSTVSRFLNGQKVKKKTEEALKQAIEELNFHRNANARRLVLNRTQTIAVVVDDISNHFYSLLIRGIEQVVEQKEYNCIYLSWRTNYRDEASFLNLFREGQVDGLIFLSFRKRTPEIVKTIRDSGYPVAMIGDIAEQDDLYAVDVDNSAGIRELVAYLHRLGHRQIAYLTGPDHTAASLFRYQGYRKAIEELQLDYREDWVVETDWTNEGGYRSMQTLLGRSGFTAVVASSDATAVGALRAIQERGFQVPRDYSVVGFDDIPIAGWVFPPLTTVRQPFKEMGIRAAEGLLKKLDNEDPEERLSLLKPELVIRQSCGPL
ncbi:LacI family transcriptional regulator [Paenibacillus sp. CC-CFT747]|nr:LacI family transcriptional regulator [Paenibacillus sp. CC-CFT747]